MYVLLEVERNTDLIEVLCVAKSRGINYEAVQDLEEILDIYRPLSVPASFFPTPEKTPVRRKPVKKPKVMKDKAPPSQPPPSQAPPSQALPSLAPLSLAPPSQARHEPFVPRFTPGDMETYPTYEPDHLKYNSNSNESMSYQYLNNNNKNNRIINKENTRVSSTSCAKCGIAMPYTTQKSLMIHARTHFKKMGYSCSDCGALFFQYVAASNHISLCHMGTLAVVRDILTNEDMRDLEKCMRECFTTESLFPVKATYIPKLNLLPKPLLQATDSNSSVGSDVICIDDSDDDIGSVDVQGIGLPLREGH